MRAPSEWWSRVRSLAGRRAMEEGLDEEIRFHIEKQTEKNLRQGMSPEAARRAAVLKFGGVERVKEEVRDEVRLGLLEDGWQDVRYGWRVLRRTPLFTALAVLSLALGIGANTAIFSVVNAVLLRPLPYPGAEALEALRIRGTSGDGRGSALSIADFRALETLPAYSAVGAYYRMPGGVALSGDGAPQLVKATAVTSGVLRALGVAPELGRGIVPAEDREGAPVTVVLSHAFWRERMGGSPGVIGRTLLLDGEPHVVVGVMPEGFHLPGIADDDLWPVMQLEAPEAHAPFFLDAVARRRSGLTDAQLAAQLRTLAARVKAQWPDSPANWEYRTTPLKEALVSDTRATVLILFGAVGLLLLLAAANVANLLLARATVRLREMAVRTALGAGRARLVRQLLTESVLIAALGGVLGLLLAYGGVRVLARLVPADLPRMDEVGVDGTVLLFTLVTALAVGLLVGLVPALRVPQRGLRAVLQEGGRGGGEGRERGRIRSLLVVLEFATALVVLIGAGLVVNSLMRLQRVDPGVTADDALVVRLALPRVRYPEEEQMGAFYDALLRRVRALPGVEAAGVSMAVPPDRLVMSNSYTPEGKVYASGESAPVAHELLVSPGYMEALGIHVTRGRGFTEADRAGAEPVVIVNEALARRHFAGRDPLGRWIQTGDPDPRAPKLRIVGVVPDVKYAGLEQEPTPTLYLPYAQNSWWRSMYVVVRGSGAPLARVAALRAEVAALDPQVPLQEVHTLRELMGSSVAEPRFRALLLGGFAAVALLLAIAGIYGVMSYTVSQRERETGVRVALGARPGAIVRMVVGGGMRLALTGVVVGLVGAFFLTRLLESVLFQVDALDPATFLLMAALLSAVAGFACWLPAHRAARTDPMVALRSG